MAVPSTTGQPASLARITATSRAGVAQALLLLERGVVLFVDDDQGEPRQRGEHREPRAEHDAGLAACRREPGRGRARPRRALCITAMRASGKACRKRASSCGVRLISGTSTSAWPPSCEHARDQAQVHLGLAAAGDAVQQERLEAAERAADRARWRAPARRSACGWTRSGAKRAPRPRLRAPFSAEASTSAGAAAARRSPFAERAVVVRGEEAHQLQPVARQARRVAEDAHDRLELAPRGPSCASRFLHHDADARARAERHDDAVAGGTSSSSGARVVEQRGSGTSSATRSTRIVRGKPLFSRPESGRAGITVIFRLDPKIANDAVTCRRKGISACAQGVWIRL